MFFLCPFLRTQRASGDEAAPPTEPNQTCRSVCPTGPLPPLRRLYPRSISSLRPRSRTRRRPLWLTRGNGRSGLPASARSFLSSADRDWCHSSEMFGARCVATSVLPRRTEAATSPAVPESRNVGCSKDSPRMRKTGLPGPLSAGFRCQTRPSRLSTRGELAPSGKGFNPVRKVLSGSHGANWGQS
jgi:hypothetical protein